MKKISAFVLFLVCSVISFAQKTERESFTDTEFIKIIRPHKNTEFDISKISKILGFKLININGCKNFEENLYLGTSAEVWQMKKDTSLQAITQNIEIFQKKSLTLEEAIISMGILYKDREVFNKDRYILIPITKTNCFQRNFLVLYCSGKEIHSILMPEPPTKLQEGDYVILKK